MSIEHAGQERKAKRGEVQFNRTKFAWREMRNPLLGSMPIQDDKGGKMFMMPITLHLLTQGASARGQTVAAVRRFGRTWIAPDGVVPCHLMAEMKVLPFKYDPKETLANVVPWSKGYINSSWSGGDAWTGAKVRQFLSRRHSPKQVEVEVSLPVPALKDGEATKDEA
mmetsp:Transcript_24106/g.55673  ORF Transcript_24106/g.55673 Transcript_24106/m.55673 type:complete len:167 (+) Transcript_24106:85-585(+)